MNTIITVIAAIARVLLPAIINDDRLAMYDHDPGDSLRKRARDRVSRQWGALCVAGLCVVIGGGCMFGPRAVYVHDGDPVRIRETVEDVPVWVVGADGETIEPSTMDIREGWYALPIPPSD